MLTKRTKLDGPVLVEAILVDDPRRTRKKGDAFSVFIQGTRHPIVVKPHQLHDIPAKRYRDRPEPETDEEIDKLVARWERGGIGVRIRESRQARNLTQREVAEAVGVSQQTVAGWEGDRFRPRWPQVRLLERYFGW